ncbi:Hint domain-containing protein [Marinibacterium sp. SX1]|uniref:Hint domain-containing protein n=1 Tax=Marinibacterium sp. SX1 TaxID=3388424 RepID=UPI003D16DC58
MADLTYTSATALTYAQTIFGPDVTITGATLIGNSGQTRIYDNGDAIAPEVTPADSGVIFSTGQATNFNAGSGDNVNNLLNSDMNQGQAGDSDIEATVPGSTLSYDAAGIEVTFTANVSGTYEIPLTFLTEEYPEYYNSNFSDSAAVYIDDGSGQQQVPVSGQQGGYFNINSMEDGPFLNNGNTGNTNQYGTDFNAAKTGTVSISVVEGQTYTLKIVVADFGDASYDSALMIGEGAFFSDPIPCFCRGTRILTLDGERPVEELREGDKVFTRDNGFQHIRWIGSRRLSARHLVQNPKLAPILIRAGALGPNQPMRDLRVSPQHRVLVRSKIARRMFGTDEILVTARQLLDLDGIEQLGTDEGVEYFHFLLSQHEVVLSDGAATESLYAGTQTFRMIPAEARAELLHLFPELERAEDRDIGATSARPLVNGKRARLLATRHVKNRKPLYDRAA